ncbi:MAG TPA: carboxymuconolactone decarboxylase family protein [Solirubrobacteraceae bacterium]|nr:carboxymuconolactone decarboxylase family protein [Solirubrobacteraceae bacterium]
MRPAILEHGYGLGPRLLFRLIRLASGRRLPDAARITFYRSDFYGNPAKKLTQAAMRGDSAWSVGDRELMAAYVSKLNDCPFCVGAHTATATAAYGDKRRVAAVLADLDSAEIAEGLRATLRLLGTLARTGTARVDDIRTVLDAGVSPEQIEDALAVAFAFNTTDRLANAFAFEVLDEDGFEAGAKYLLRRGYG